MRVALLSCGPSIASYPGRDGFDLVIGVNSIVERHECDYWVFGDAETFEKTRELREGCAGRVPRLVTDAAAAFNLTHNSGVETASRFLTWPRGPHWEEFENPLPLDTQLCFSSCAALLLTRHLKATSLQVFGVDLAGDRDWAGRRCNGRDPEWWERERFRWDRLLAWVIQ